MSVPEFCHNSHFYKGYKHFQWIYWQAWFPLRCDTFSYVRILYFITSWHLQYISFYISRRHTKSLHAWMMYSMTKVQWSFQYSKPLGSFITVYHGEHTEAKHGNITMLWHATLFCHVCVIQYCEMAECMHIWYCVNKKQCYLSTWFYTSQCLICLCGILSNKSIC